MYILHPVLFRTSVSGILSCHLIFSSFLRQLVYGSGSVFRHAVGKLSKFHMRIIVLTALHVCRFSALCQA